MKQLTLASLFDGSGGFPLAGMLAGIVPVWASEIEPFPVRVTTKRMPFVKHYGDVSAINGAEVEPVDIVTFGSPCQDMSVAGKRAGIAGARSGLFYEALRIIEEMREATNGEKPRWCVWENVTGAYSSNGGEDFRAVLEAVAGVKDRDARIPGLKKWEHAGLIMGGAYSIAWRTLDAQYWGVPQRRKRIFLVADFNGGSAGKVLFESESMSGHFGKNEEAGEKASGDTGKGVDPSSLGVAVVALQGSVVGRSEKNGPQGCGYDERVSFTLNTVDRHVVAAPQTLRIRAGCEGGGKGALIQNDKSGTLGTTNDQTVFIPKSSVAESWALDRNHFMTKAIAERAGSLCATDYKDPPPVFQLMRQKPFICGSTEKTDSLTACDHKGPVMVLVPGEYIVRRLTPTECARLQGFPDWWCDDLGTDEPTEEEIEFWAEVFETHRRIVTGASKSRSRAQIIKWLKNPHTDGAEYKMWGNGVALPCVEFVLSGIAREANNETEDQDDAWAFLEEDKQMSIWDYMR